MARKSNIYLIDGVEYPAVTSILALKDKSGPLMGWAVKMAIEEADRGIREFIDKDKPLTYAELEIILSEAKKAYRTKQDEAKNIGSKVHNAIEVFTKAKDNVEGLRLVRALSEYPEIELPFGAFLKWEKENQFILVKGEHQVHSKHYRFAGTLDAIAQIKGKLTLADFKSSTSIRDEYVWQVSAYYKAYCEMGIKEGDIENWGCLRLDKLTGKPEWKEWTKDEVEEAFEKFRCLLNLWWLEKDSKKEVRNASTSKT